MYTTTAYVDIGIVNNEVWFANIIPTRAIYGKLSMTGTFMFRTQINSTFTTNAF